MNLRIAKKICKKIANMDIGESSPYSEEQIQTALNRIERTKSQKDATQFWNHLMVDLGVEGRAEVLADIGAPGMAFDLLMREEW